MKLQFSTRCFRITIELIRLGPEPVFRRYRVVPRDAVVRRRLLRTMRDRLGNRHV